jgi:hypothetical protein
MAGRGFHICSFTDFDNLLMTAGGHSYRFEFSKRFGPLLLGKRGQTLTTLPPVRSAFWKALQLWCQQGYLVDADVCVYTIPPPERGIRLAGVQVIMLGPTDDPSLVRDRWYGEIGEPLPPDPPDVVVFDEWACLR